jgi:hypothetical protein
MKLLIELGVAPALAALATVAGRRWGARAGGVVSAFPAIVGPVLLLAAVEHGDAFAAQAANGTLLGLIAMSGFALGYGRAALTRPWLLCLAAGWALAAVTGLLVGVLAPHAAAPVGLVVAVTSLIAVQRALPHAEAPAPPPMSLAGALFFRMALTALLVTILAAASSRLGPSVGGMLAALPVLATVLAVFAHREGGGAVAVAWLRGMLRGMGGFVAFCEVVALLIGRYGTAPALAAATVTALFIQMLSARPGRIIQRSV